MTKKVYLIYNSQCDFCKNTARYFNRKLRGKLNILSNRSAKAKTLVFKRDAKNLEKDIHFVISKTRTYSRGMACYYLLRTQYPGFILPEFMAFLIFEPGYIVLKKIKKYL